MFKLHLVINKFKNAYGFSTLKSYDSYSLQYPYLIITFYALELS